MSQHIRLGRLGEQAAAGFLRGRGVQILSQNLVIGKGELDIVAQDDAGRFAVEVKTGYQSDDFHPRWNFDDQKAQQVASLSRSVGIRRVDLITVAISSTGLMVEWYPRVA